MAADNDIYCLRGGFNGMCVNMPQPYIQARILWPALGFPEVVQYKNSFELLLLSEKSGLTSNGVSKYLRYVEWGSRTRRDCTGLGDKRNSNEGGFESDEITVKKIEVEDADDLVEKLEFANLSKFVREFYKEHGLAFLYHIKIRTETNPIDVGHYNLFWKNDTSHNDKISMLVHLCQIAAVNPAAIVDDLRSPPRILEITHTNVLPPCTGLPFYTNRHNPAMVIYNFMFHTRLRFSHRPADNLNRIVQRCDVADGRFCHAVG